MNICPSVQDISKSYPRIRMKLPEYVKFAKRTNRLHFDEDLISGKRIFRTISNVSNVSNVKRYRGSVSYISRTDRGRGRTNDLSTYT